LQLLIAILTFATMVGFNVFTKGYLRLYCVLIGCSLGYALAYFTGILSSEDLHSWARTPWFDFPNPGYFGLSFRWSLFGPFALAAAASTFKSIGDVALCQKINDSDWQRPDMKSISNGINADGWASTVSGLLGGMGPSTYSSSIGVSVATGATSRVIAYAMGAILVLLSFVPKFAAIFVIMPKPVIGASVVFAVCFMLLTGIQIIQSRLLDTRKIFVIGISLALGLSVDMVPQAYSNVPGWLSPFTSSSLAFSTVVVVILNLVMRIGIKKTVRFEFQAGQGLEKISSEIESQGGAWGARKDVIYRVVSAIKEFVGSSKELEIVNGLIHTKVSFDEFNLDVRIVYHGKVMPFPEDRPLRAEFRTDPLAVLRLSGFMIRQYCDRFEVSQEGEEVTLLLHFDH
jgi:xanthine permease XanP